MPRRLAALCILAAALTGAAEAPQPLTGRQLDNLAAFARLLSLVRFFHPSDAVAKADWNRVAVAGVGAVRDAADPEDLARRLDAFFRPLAPTSRVSAGARPDLPEELRPPDDSRSLRTVAWRHFGGDFGAERKIFSSERIDDHNPPSYGTLAQAILAGPLQGRRVRLTAWVKAEMEGTGRVQLGLRVDRAGGKPGFFDNMADRPLHTTPWRKVEIEGDVAPDAERILVLLVVTGGGQVWLDEVSLAPVEGGSAKTLDNAGFETGETDTQPPGWLFPYESVRAGYHLLLRRGDACRRGGCAEIVSDPIATPRFVRPDQVVEADLGGGVTAWVPVALYADVRGTLPHVPIPPPPAVAAAADTQESRLAAVALAWGIFQHLHPELRVEDPAWSGILRPTLAEAAAADDPDAFRTAMKRLLVPLHNALAGIYPREGSPEPWALPLSWEPIEGKVVITGAGEGVSSVRPGDVVTSLDGKPIEEALAAAEALASAGTPEARRWKALDRLLIGPPGSRAVLGMERDGAPTTVSLDRVSSDVLPAGTPWKPVDEPRPGIVYVDLGRIEEAELEPLMPRLAAARGIVFDLRHEPNISTVLLSHLIDRTASSSKWQVPVVMAPDHRDVQWLTTFWTIEPKAPRLHGKVAFLMDGRAAGYVETRLGMIEAYRLGERVGARSGGSNGSTNWATLPGGWRLVWMGQRVLKHDGSPLQGVGVAPTVPVERTLRGVAAGRDEIVDRAVEVVGRS